MVTLATPDEMPAATREVGASAPGRSNRTSVMLMSVGGRLAVVAAGIAAIWTAVALALT